MSQIPMTPIIPILQLSGQPEKQTANLVRALESPVAYIDGDPTNSDGLELYYYRFVGPLFFGDSTCINYDLCPVRIYCNSSGD